MCVFIPKETQTQALYASLIRYKCVASEMFEYMGHKLASLISSLLSLSLSPARLRPGLVAEAGQKGLDCHLYAPTPRKTLPHKPMIINVAEKKKKRALGETMKMVTENNFANRLMMSVVRCR